MNIKEELITFREEIARKKPSMKFNNYMVHELGKIFGDSTKKQEQCEETKVVPIVLDDKVDEFIKWYGDNMVDSIPEDLRNFIEKMAVWYELRYPDYEINRKFRYSEQEFTQISDIMFNQNKYINEQLNEESEIRILDWDEFYNTNAFINSLPFKEKKFISKPRYQSQIGIRINEKKYHYFLTSNGYIRTYNHSNKISINDKEEKTFNFIDIDIEKFLSFLKDGNFELSQYDIKYIEDAIQRYKNECYAKEELLNCVMYRIIERGGNQIGPRRALLFAKEFNRNIDIPMIYAVNYSDIGLRLFMNEYIKSGGSKDLECYANYFSRTNKYEKLNTVTIQELIKYMNNDAANFYTPEENGLHQRMVNALASQIDEKKVQQETIKQLRLKRKLNSNQE